MKKLTRNNLPNADTLEKLKHAIYSSPIETIKKKLQEFNCNPHGKDDVLKDRLLRYNKRVLGIDPEDWHNIFDVDSISPTEIEKYVKSLEPQVIASELERYKCVATGTVKVLQGRLTRFYLKQKGFETRWSTSDLRPVGIIPKTQTEIPESESDMKGKNSKNYTSKRSKKHSKSSNQTKTSESTETSKPTEKATESATETEEIQETETIAQAGVPPIADDNIADQQNNILPNTTVEHKVLNFKDLNDDTQLTVGMMKQIIADLVSGKLHDSFSDSSISIKSSTAIKNKRTSKRTPLPNLSPIAKNSSTSDSESGSQSKASQLSKVLDELRIDMARPKKISHKKRPPTSSSSSDSRRLSDARLATPIPKSKRKSHNRHKRHVRDTSSSSSDSTLSSSSSSSSDSRHAKKRTSRPKRKSIDLPQVYKIMKSFDLKFSGNENENAELFLEELLDCVENSKLDKASALKAVPRMLTSHAKKWYQGEKNYIRTWSDFKKKFKKRFVPYHDDGDVYEDLHSRTQGDGERIAEYINNVKLIAAYFKYLPFEKTLVKRTIKNLLPKYRTFIRDRKISTFDKLQAYGQKYERELDELNRYTAPKPKELMHIKYAAFTPKESKSKTKTAASTESVPATIVSPKKNKRPNKRAKTTTAAITQPSNPADPKVSNNPQRPVKVFSGVCRLCNHPGHRAFHCPTRNNRIVCWGCGDLNVMYPNCVKCQARKEQWENSQKSTGQSPPSAQ